MLGECRLELVLEPCQYSDQPIVALLKHTIPCDVLEANRTRLGRELAIPRPPDVETEKYDEDEE